jgi:spoIIIJ-associated protein
MKIYEYEGKTLEEAKEKALAELNANESELFIRETESAKGFLKAKKIKLEIITKDDVIKFSKDYIVEIAKSMKATVNIEAKKRDHFIQINIFSDNSSILIGRGGKTLESIQTLIKSSIFNTTGFKVNVVVDVEDYKEKVNKHLEYDVKNIAKEVRRTGVDAKLDPMNSYERRIVHSAVGEIQGVITISEGEEPNRYVVIKKDEK